MVMDLKNMRVLMIGHDHDATIVRKALADAEDRAFTVECATLLSDGLDRLRRNSVAAVMLDLRLPDSQGLATFEQLRQAAPDVALLIINSADDQDLARHAVRRGAQDYLQKDRIDPDSLPRALRHIIERKAKPDPPYVDRPRADDASPGARSAPQGRR
jgi:DNA-binding NarL/FixJ family response regulator